MNASLVFSKKDRSATESCFDLLRLISVVYKELCLDAYESAPPVKTPVVLTRQAERLQSTEWCYAGWRADRTIVYGVVIRVYLKKRVEEVEKASSSHTGNVIYMRRGSLCTCVLRRRLQHC